MPDTHYGTAYFSWQSQVGEAGATLNQFKFLPWLTGEDVVLDFGCGGGALLAALPARERIGVEVGEPAAEAARGRGITVHPTTGEIPDASMDIVISNHALEHVERPLDELRELLRVLKPGSRGIFVVPINDWRSERRPNPRDRNHHLYTWTPLLFANLLSDAGFEVESCRVLSHAWKPRLLPFHGRFPRAYKAVTKMLAVALRSRQIHAVATRPRS